MTPGTRFGPYEIVAPLGAGGMGEVYRARDTRLERTVALKVLRADVAADPQFRARFDREARAISHLSHPNICTLHDVGEHNGTAYFVMELLEGQTLASRLEKGALPLDEALKIAIQIGDALSTAHKRGIVHRDLKPANIMLTKTGAKLLDFGLAKRAEPALALGAISTHQTAATSLTSQGTILGTLHYMSPEQVEGREADARSDIWAFGAVLYEMATGARPFTGDTPASIVGAILKDTPTPLASRQPIAPAALDRLVSVCLAKDPEDRWQSTSDVKQHLQWIAGSSLSPSELSTVAKKVGQSDTARRWTLPTLLALAGVAALIASVFGFRTSDAPAPLNTIQLSFLAPPQTTFSSPPSSVTAPQLAISPDGSTVVFVAEARGARPNLWVRTLSASAAQQLRGTDDAIYPFWSPDSKSVGFFAQGKLKTIDIAGGPPRMLSDSPLDSRGGTWAPDGTIVFSPREGSQLYKIPANGGGPAALATSFDDRRGETSHRFPSMLPDGRHFLYTTRNSRQQQWGTSIGSLDSIEGKPLIDRSESGARFAPPDHVLFLRSGTLMAQKLDLTRLSVVGEPMAVTTDVGATTTGYSAFSVSSTGVVVYARHLGVRGQLRWFDRQGNGLGSVGDAAEYLDFELSPDERSVSAAQLDDPGTASADIWLFDLARNLPARLTTNPTNDASALWSPDGGRVVFRSNREGYVKLYQKRPGGTETELMVLHSGSSLIPTDWSRDGRTILFSSTTSASGGFQIFRWSIDGVSKPEVVVQSMQNAIHGSLSPNGRWLTYASDESGRFEVYVQPFPGGGERRQLSASGGNEPRWRRDGNELFYLSDSDTLMSVEIPGGNAFNARAARPLFDARVPLSRSPYRKNYAVAADGTRFLVNTRVEDTVSPISVILNWSGLLKK